MVSCSSTYINSMLSSSLRFIIFCWASLRDTGYCIFVFTPPLAVLRASEEPVVLPLGPLAALLDAI